MPDILNSQNAQVGAEDVSRTQCDQQRRDLVQTAVSGNRDCRSAALIQSRSNPTPFIQTWIDNIQLYRFPLAIAVVAVHAGEFVANLVRASSSGGDSVLSLWLVDFLTTICRLATPSFLLISGLIFFKDGEVSRAEYCRKAKSRCRTLLVPYLVWNFAGVLLLCAPASFKYFFFSPEFYTYTPLSLAGVAKWVVGWPVYPADGPLWFVRDLLLLIAVVPVLSFIPRRVQMIGLGTLFLYWALFPLDVIPGGIPRAFSVLFFMVGVATGMNQALLQIVAKARWLLYASAAVLVSSAAGTATCNALGEDYSGLGSFLQKGVRLSGALLMVCLGSRSLLPASMSLRLLQLAPTAFFLFASHYLVLIGITPLVMEVDQVLGQGYEVLLFGLVSGAMIGVSLAFYFMLKRHAPFLLGILDGNRSLPGLLEPKFEPPKMAAAWNDSKGSSPLAVQ